jgi:predicted TIM-barrel enzyme
VNRIAEVFGTSHVLLPVIHPISRDAAIEASRVAHTCGVKGVFLIDQGMHERNVLQLAREVRDRWPSLWIGLNLLTRTPADALSSALKTCGFVDGIWSDNAGIDERGSDHPRAHPRAQCFVDTQRATSWNGLYFGGVAFKYQREVASADLARAAALATPYMDVLCTSGPGTGHAADVEKVRDLRVGLGNRHAMALASGITPENVQIYMPYVQAFLVGTGIEESLGVFDPEKIEALLKAMQ